MIKKPLVILITLAMLTGCSFNKSSRSESCCAEGYSVAQIKIEPAFTQITNDKIKTYVTLLDEYGEAIKSLGTFRFELFRYQKATAEPRGKRFEQENGLQTIELNDLHQNQSHYDSITRSYKINLKLPTHYTKEILLQATFILPNGPRVTDFIVLSTK